MRYDTASSWLLQQQLAALQAAALSGPGSSSLTAIVQQEASRALLLLDDAAAGQNASIGGSALQQQHSTQVQTAAQHLQHWVLRKLASCSSYVGPLLHAMLFQAWAKSRASSSSTVQEQDDDSWAPASTWTLSSSQYAQLVQALGMQSALMDLLTWHSLADVAGALEMLRNLVKEHPQLAVELLPHAASCLSLLPNAPDGASAIGGSEWHMGCMQQLVEAAASWLGEGAAAGCITGSMALLLCRWCSLLLAPGSAAIQGLLREQREEEGAAGQPAAVPGLQALERALARMDAGSAVAADDPSKVLQLQQGLGQLMALLDEQLAVHMAQRQGQQQEQSKIQEQEQAAAGHAAALPFATLCHSRARCGLFLAQLQQAEATSGTGQAAHKQEDPAAQAPPAPAASGSTIPGTSSIGTSWYCAMTAPHSNLDTHAALWHQQKPQLGLAGLLAAWLTPGLPCPWSLPSSGEVMSLCGPSCCSPLRVAMLLLELMQQTCRQMESATWIALAAPPSAGSATTGSSQQAGSRETAPLAQQRHQQRLWQQLQLLHGMFTDAAALISGSDAQAALLQCALHSRHAAALQQALNADSASCAAASRALVAISNRLSAFEEHAGGQVLSKQQELQLVADMGKELLPHSALFPALVLQRLLSDAVHHPGQQAVVLQMLSSMVAVAQLRRRGTAAPLLLRELVRLVLGPGAVLQTAADARALASLAQGCIAAGLLQQQQVLQHLVVPGLQACSGGASLPVAGAGDEGSMVLQLPALLLLAEQSLPDLPAGGSTLAAASSTAAAAAQGPQGHEEMLPALLALLEATAGTVQRLLQRQAASAAPPAAELGQAMQLCCRLACTAAGLLAGQPEGDVTTTYAFEELLHAAGSLGWQARMLLLPVWELQHRQQEQDAQQQQEQHSQTTTTAPHKLGTSDLLHLLLPASMVQLQPTPGSRKATSSRATGAQQQHAMQQQSQGRKPAAAELYQALLALTWLCSVWPEAIQHVRSAGVSTGATAEGPLHAVLVQQLLQLLQRATSAMVASAAELVAAQALRGWPRHVTEALLQQVLPVLLRTVAPETPGG